MTTARTTIKPLDDNHVVIRYADCYTGEIIEREFWAPSGGGYVREIDAAHPGTTGRQVCELLEGVGPTLYWGGHGRLIDVVRREYRAMRRVERREQQR
jgi:hypothetical protein